ncbi:SET domain containing 2 isoform X2 [Rhodnius prolixus]|uniref:SET domain containing 2 isoform X2 n=1 Tax=Rhodnius prolixus TaxID=13249 RepID=UPI003D18BA2C
MARKKRTKTPAKRNTRRKSDTDQNSNETLEDEHCSNKNVDFDSPVIDEHQLSGTSGCPPNEKSSHKRFGKFRCLERRYSSSQEDESDEINTENLKPQDIQHIVLGDMLPFHNTTIRKDEDELGDTCLQGEIGHEEIIEATMVCENITCDIEEVAIVANSIEIYNDEDSVGTYVETSNSTKTLNIVEGIQAMNVQDSVVSEQPLVDVELPESAPTDPLEIQETDKLEEPMSVEESSNVRESNDSSETFTVNKSEKVKCYPVKKSFKTEPIPLVPNSDIAEVSADVAADSPSLPIESLDFSDLTSVPTEKMCEVESAKLESINVSGEDVAPKTGESDVAFETVIKTESEFKKEVSEDKIENTVKLENTDVPQEKTEEVKCSKTKTEEPTTSRRRSNRIKVNRWSDVEPEVKPVVDIVSPPPPLLPAVPIFETDKPVKVKSRWRRTSELEMGATVTTPETEQFMMLSVKPLNPLSVADIPTKLPINRNDPEVEERLKTFQIIIQNEFHTVRYRSKEAKRMVCDCTLSKEEIARGEFGCGEDCLNRLLMIECGSRCVLGDLCSNKRFQNCQYARCEVVKTPKKGLGLVASVDIARGEFLLEYVGEVLDQKEFRRRAKEYAKEKNKHYYFMALKSDTVIDATSKGNVSRFINHSCDPNAETQKWTVNGELRIGFFSKRFIAQGEEITFDYQLQRYGKEAQRCYCESKNCRGWIGEDPEKDKDRDKNWSKKERKEKKRKEDKRKDLREVDLEEEIEKLSTSGVKNQAHTLMLSRLMVRAEDRATRLQLLSIAQAADDPCRQLFVDYHGLTLLWSWMMDNHSTNKIKLEILKTLQALPITNKTILRDSKVLSVVEKWANKSSDSPNEERKERNGEDEEGGSTESGDSPTAETGKTEDESKDGSTNEGGTSAEVTEQEEHSEQEVVELASALLSKWADLKEDFRIPKKQRIEQMKEHEREADRGYSDPRETQSYDRHWSYDKDGGRYGNGNGSSSSNKERRRGRDSPDNHDWNRKSRGDDSRNGNSQRMSKMQRRQLFAMKVEEEERQRKQVEEMWTKHQEQCVALGVDPNQTTLFNNNYPPYYPPLPPPHMQDGMMEGGDMNIFGGGMMPGPRYPPQGGGPLPPGFIGGPPPPRPMCPPHQFPAPANVPYMDQQFHGVPPPQFPQPPPPQVYGPPPPLPPPQYQQQPQPAPFPFPSPTPPPGLVVTQGHAISMAQPPPPQAMEVVVPPPAVLAQVPPPQIVPTALQTTVVASPATTSTTTKITSALAPPPPPPPQTVMLPFKLPPKWKAAKDKEGRIYYYHVKTRKSQWQIPVAQRTTTTTQVSDSDSDTSDTSEEDDTSSDDEDEKEEEDEDEVEYDDLLLTEAKRKVKAGFGGRSSTVTASSEEVPHSEPEVVQEPVLKKRREGLVQVNIISPRDEESDYRKGVKKSKIRETKEKLLKQKLVRLKRNRDIAKSCEADTSSGPSRRIKDLFRIQMANEVVACLNPYRKQDCKVARITNTEDFKHLARKLTHFVMVKELKHCSSIEELACNDNVKHKARDFIRKYMNKFGPVYTRSPDD